MIMVSINTNTIMKKVEDWHIAGLGAFLFQVSEKDRMAQATYFNTLDVPGKLMYVADIAAGRTVGFTPFTGVSKPGSFPPVFNPQNAINKVSEIGAGLWLLGELGILPAWTKKYAKEITWGGVLGGVFDDPYVPTFQAYNSGMAQNNQFQTAASWQSGY